MWKSYVTALHPARVIKVTPEIFTAQEDIIKYEKDLEILKELGIIKQ
jgi:hypothetical protein